MHGIKYLTNWLTNAYQELFCKNATGSIKADTNHIIERSVLAANLDRIDPFTVGQRRRYATCSGIAWLNHDHLAEVNYYGKHLRIYRVTTGHSSGKPSLTILHELKNLPCFPEQVACSPDGSMLAITHTMTQGDFGVSLYRIDSKDYTPHVMNPVLRKGNAFHGICFSLDSCHLVFTHVQKPGYTECVDLHTGATTFRFENRNFPLVQKGVAFSYDNRYLAIVSARNIHPKSQEGDFPFLVSVYRYHGQEGRIDELPVAEYTCSLHEFNSAEDCTFFPAQKSGIYQLLVVDQANDQVLDFKFDESQRSITYEGIFTLDVSFPHGIAFSPDGCLLAIANYGGDALRIFKYPAGQGSRFISGLAGRIRGVLKPGKRRRMRLALVSDHTYLPDRVGGRESSIHDLAVALLRAGHAVRVISRRAGTDEGASRFEHLLWQHQYRVDRVLDVHEHARCLLQNSRVDLAIYSCHSSEKFVLDDPVLRTRQVFYVRDVGEVYSWNENTFPPETRFMANSGFVADAVSRHTGITPNVVLPVIDPVRYITKARRHYVTFINPVDCKGVGLAIEIANLCPEIPFQFVECWPLAGKKFDELKEKLSPFHNIVLERAVIDMRKIYRRTGILLVPSQCEEGFGRVVIEAQFSGIPVLASRIGGLPEAAGDGGILLSHNAGAGIWARELRAIWHNENQWHTLSVQARMNAEYYASKMHNTLETFLDVMGRPHTS